MGLAKMKLERPPIYTGLNVESYNAANRAEQEVLGNAKKFVLDPFTRGVRLSTGYSDENIPSGEIEIEVPVGKYTFGITAKPSVKRPSYSELLQQVTDFLEHLVNQYDSDISRKGIVTMGSNGERGPYVDMDIVLENYRKGKGEILKKGVSFGQIQVPDEIPVQGLEKLLVPLINFEERTTETGLFYAQTKVLYTEVKANPYEMFWNAVKKTSGFDKDNIPKQTEIVLRQLNSDLGYTIQVIPHDKITYKGIFDGLFGDLSKKGNPTKTTGVFTFIEDGVDIESIETLDGKYPDGKRVERMQKLDLRTSGDRRFVSLKGLVGLVEDLKEQHTKLEIDKQIPLVFQVG